MDLSKIYSRAWEIIKKFKIFWLFGFFAGCGSSGNSAGSGNSGISFSNGDVSNTNFYNLFPPAAQRWFLETERFIQDNPGKFFGIIAGSFIVMMLFSLLLAALRIYGKIGTISGVVHLEKGSEIVDFAQINPEVKKYFWRIVFLYLLAFLAALAMGALVALSVLTIILLIPMICAMFFIMLILSLLMNQIVIAMVIEDLDPLDGLKRAWAVMSANIPLYLTVAVINFFGLLIINIILSIPIFALVGTWLLVDSFKFFGMMAGLILFGIIYAFILAPVNGFKEITWVLTYAQAAKLDFKEAEEEILELEEETT